MFSLRLSRSSELYFKNLKEYLLTNFGDKTKQEVLRKEEQKLENLRLFPFMGVKATKFSNLLTGYYVLADKYEYIFYRVDEDNRSISVELVLSTKEDTIQKIRKYFEN